MLDRKFIAENASLVEENCIRRNSKADIGKFVALETERRKLQHEVDELNRQANEAAKSIGKAKPEEREALKAKGRELRDQTTAAAEKLAAIEAERRTAPALTQVELLDRLAEVAYGPGLTGEDLVRRACENLGEVGPRVSEALRSKSIPFESDRWTPFPG